MVGHVQSFPNSIPVVSGWDRHADMVWNPSWILHELHVTGEIAAVTGQQGLSADVEDNMKHMVVS